MTPLDRRQAGAFDGPAAAQPRRDGLCWSAQGFRPFDQQTCFPTTCHQPIYAPIAALRAARRPDAVARRVGPIVIDPFDRMSRRRFRAHVGVEPREVLPRRADRNPTTSVVVERVVLRITAPAFHLVPRDVFRAVGQPVRWRQHRQPQAVVSHKPRGLASPKCRERRAAATAAQAGRLHNALIYHDSSIATTPLEVGSR